MSTSTLTTKVARPAANVYFTILLMACLISMTVQSVPAAGFATVDFQQAANENHPTDALQFLQGILNPNNSDYFEGVGVPQRIVFTGIQATSGDAHVLNLHHQAVKGGI